MNIFFVNLQYIPITFRKIANKKIQNLKMFQFFWDPKSGQTGVLPGQSQINFVRLSLQFWLQIYQKKTPPSGADLKMLYKKNWTILGQNTNCLAHFGAQLKFSEALRKVKKVTI